jgi:hypothetical protein
VNVIKIILASALQRETALRRVREAPLGWVVRISEPSKTRDQEDKYHAQIRDIARQVAFAGQLWDEEDVKRLLVDAFAKVMREAGTPLTGDGRVVPSLDGERVLQLGIQTRRFKKAEASAFIEFLYALGAECDVVWREAPPEEIAA